jgi:hypothetical protein
MRDIMYDIMHDMIRLEGSSVCKLRELFPDTAHVADTATASGEHLSGYPHGRDWL